jgi:hypothetical protein
MCDDFCIIPDGADSKVAKKAYLKAYIEYLTNYKYIKDLPLEKQCNYWVNSKAKKLLMKRFTTLETFIAVSES